MANFIYNSNYATVIIPLYRLNSDGSFEENKIENRIVVIEQDIVNQPIATFPGELFFGSLIDDYYSGYQKIIKRPKMIEVSLLLSDLDIYTLDMMTPVYIEQTGNYYIIYELQIDGNNVAKAKLLQM